MSSGATQPIVHITDLSLTYNPGKPTEFKALKNINLKIYPEEFVIFFGPSGSGKSTLLYIIAGLETPSSGVVSVAGKKDLAKLAEKELIEYHRTSVGMIFQAFYLIPSLTARDNVMLPMVFRGSEPNERKNTVNQLLERFGITSFSERTPTHMSGGQQQRVAIARSLVNDPEVVLADEPVGNLDSKNSEIVLDLIKDLHTKDKKTVILVTHDPNHLQYADRVFYIKDGEIVRTVVQKAKDRVKTAPGEETPDSDHKSLLNKLALQFPNLDESRLRAKLLVNFILLPYDFETLELVESLVSDFISKKLSEKELLEKLDKPTQLGGVGLYKQTTQKLLKEVKDILNEMELVEHVHSQSDPELAKAKKIQTFILKNETVELSEAQQERLAAAISFRLKGKFTKEQLLNQIDKPYKELGVGLNKRTAKHLSQEIEIVLMQENL